MLRVSVGDVSRTGTTIRNKQNVESVAVGWDIMLHVSENCFPVYMPFLFPLGVVSYVKEFLWRGLKNNRILEPGKILQVSWISFIF